MTTSPAAFLTPIVLLPKHSRKMPSLSPRNNRSPTVAVAIPPPQSFSDRHKDALVFVTPKKSPAATKQRVPADNLHLQANRAHYRITVVASQWDQLSHVFASVSALVQAADGAIQSWRSLGPTASDALVTLPLTMDIESLRANLYAVGRHDSVDVVLQEDSVVRAEKRLAVFDLDSTLIAQETIDELASELKVDAQVKAITERAMNGEIGFREALEERVALLRGLPNQALDGVKDRVVFTPGAAELVRALSALGCQTAVVSGGFHFLADHVRDVLGLDYSFANRLEVDDRDVLTGRTVGEIVDAEYKESTLQRLADQLQLAPQQILAVGDGSNDLLMMGRAGLGVAFNAKPIVQDRAKCRVNQTSLRNVLYLLGLSDDDIGTLVV